MMLNVGSAFADQSFFLQVIHLSWNRSFQLLGLVLHTNNPERLWLGCPQDASHVGPRVC